MNIQPCVLSHVSSSIELFPVYVLEDRFDITADRTQEFSFQVSQLIMSCDDRSASFTNHGVAYRKGLPANIRSNNNYNNNNSNDDNDDDDDDGDDDDDNNKYVPPAWKPPEGGFQAGPK